MIWTQSKTTPVNGCVSARSRLRPAVPLFPLGYRWLQWPLPWHPYRCPYCCHGSTVHSAQAAVKPGRCLPLVMQGCPPVFSCPISLHTQISSIVCLLLFLHHPRIIRLLRLLHHDGLTADWRAGWLGYVFCFISCMHSCLGDCELKAVQVYV